MAKLRLPQRRKNRKTKTERAGAPTKRRVLIEVLTGLAVVVLVGAGWSWWHYVYSNPKRVFEGMLNNNLRTTSVTRIQIQQNQTQSLQQYARLENGVQNMATSESTLTQQGDVTAKVDSESIGTPTADYVRYTHVQTSQKTSKGTAANFDSILNIWGKSDNGEQSVGNLYGDLVLGVIPIGNLNRDQRAALTRLINDDNVYTVDYTTVQRKVTSGRPQYTYNVAMDPEAYVKMLKQFGQDIGLQQLASLDPSVYHGQPKLNFRIAIDVWSHHLANILYSDSPRVEGYGGFGVSKPITVPKDSETIPVEELQTRIQTLQ